MIESEIVQPLVYKGNPLLKRKNAPVQFTLEQVNELQTCIFNPIHFFENYIYIITLDHGRTKFQPYEFQKTIISDCQRHRNNVLTCSRQSGKTTVLAAFLLWETIFQKDYTVGIVANNAQKAREILARIKMMYEELPMWMKPGVITWNKSSIEFANGSRIFAGPTTPAALRGYSINHLVWDEAAFVDNDVEFYTSAYPVISSGTNSKFTIISTPRGLNLFYKIYTDAINKRNTYNARLFTWKSHPKRDEAWKDAQIKDIGQRAFDQEHECLFLGSSDTLLSVECLTRLAWKEPIDNIDQHIKYYDKPEKDHIYVATVDVSEGVGKDYSVINITDITEKPFKQVFVYTNNLIDPWEFASVIQPIAKWYNNAYILIESNSIGKIVADTLFMEYDYDNLIHTNKKDEISFSFNTAIGSRTTKKTKTIGCATLKSLMENQFYIVNDFKTVQELYTFVKDKNTYQAEKGKTDDIAMTLVLFAWLVSEPYFENLTEKTYRDIYKKHLEEKDDHCAFGFIVDGTEDY